MLVANPEQLAVQLVRRGTTWLNSAIVDANSRQADLVLSASASNPRARASLWAKEGRVFGIELNGRLHFPAYAFEPSGQPVSAMQDVLQILSGMSPFAIAAWFESPSSMLGGKRPRELLIQDSKAVISAACELHQGPSYG